MLEYKFLFNYLQLWRSYAILRATTQRAFRSMVDILSTLRWSRLIWHNFVKAAADNWIKICSPAYVGTYNRCEKFGLKILNRLGKMSENFRGFDSHCMLLLFKVSGFLRPLSTIGPFVSRSIYRNARIDKDRLPVMNIYRQSDNRCIPAHRNPPHNITDTARPPVTPDKGECMNIIHPGFLGTSDQCTPR